MNGKLCKQIRRSAKQIALIKSLPVKVVYKALKRRVKQHQRTYSYDAKQAGSL